MDDRIIRKRISTMATSRDLHSVLNVIKQNMAKEYGVEYYPISWDDYCYFSSPRRSVRNYVSFEIPKKSGEYRHISAPVRGLKEIQKCLNYLLELIYYPKDNVTGFVRGKSIVNNASPHIGKNYIFNVDLKDFFPSIEQARVWKKLQLRPLCLTKEVASAIAGLCSMEIEDENGNKRYILPQGSPTSPMLSNIVCERLDWKLSGVARRFGLTYTRYADDITFSSMHNVYQHDGDFCKELRHIIAEEHFTINTSKVKLQKRGGHQEVTGLVISDKVNVPKAYVREIRSLLFMWECYSYAVASQKYAFYHNAYVKHRTYGGFVSLENVLDGKIEYLKMIRGGKNPLYMSLRSRLDKLIGKVTKKNIDCENVIEVVNNKNEGKKHDIEATYEVLRLFEDPNGLKFLTHDFPNTSWTVGPFIEQCRTVFYEEANRHPNIPQSLYSLVKTFILGVSNNIKGWLGYDEKLHTETWDDWKRLEEHPIKRHGGIIDIFRNTIRVRSPKLFDLIKYIEGQYTQFVFEYDSKELIKADFYTNVYILRWCMARVLSMFCQYQEYKNIHVSCSKKTMNGWIVYAIQLTQIGSFPSVDINDAIKRLSEDAGDLGVIKDKMRSYCDWSIISKWNSENLRWNILKRDDEKEVEKIEESAIGFTHEFIFYKTKYNN